MKPTYAGQSAREKGDLGHDGHTIDKQVERSLLHPFAFTLAATTVFNSRFVEGSGLATACSALGEIYPIVRSGGGRLENKRFEVVTASVGACPILEGA